MRLPFRFPQGRRHRILRLALVNWMLGASLGLACAALLLWLDIAGLRGLMWRPDRVVWEGLVLLCGGFAVTFGGVVCAAAVMTVPTADDDGGGGRGAPVSAAALVPSAETARSPARSR